MLSSLGDPRTGIQTEDADNLFAAIRRLFGSDKKRSGGRRDSK
jgi:hypothetical protein